MGYKKSIFIISILSFILFYCGSSVHSKKNSTDNSKPEWINNYKKKYPDLSFISGLGISEYKKIAENDALQGISSQFEVKIVTTQSSREITTETNSSFDKVYNEVFDVEVSTNQNLKNVQISEIYYDPSSQKYYVLATLDRNRTIEIYREDSKKLLLESENLYQKSKENTDLLGKISLMSYSILKLKQVDDIEKKLQVLGDNISKINKFSSVNNLSIEREKLLNQVKVYVSNKDEKIFNVLKREITLLGFKLSDDESDSFLKFDYTLIADKIDIKDNEAKFISWSLSIDIHSLDRGTILETYTAKGRSSQLTYELAEDRLYYNIDSNISKKFSSFLIEKLIQNK